ncbi:hypothetical protein NLX86_04830 [Streptomyces sp. A3M-1-3]|uniref:hypothetical protein n=1 Tax=Streptomyces sp. A3M-1-3 TaxID=2962044 RepID=UPI0020B8B69D|nr:hypothetical protein [Streptomyces sp. A3M-1-3]MCP3817484.1 hypothetical protein [Streptomyces sp. A3M-1-3]
MGSISTFVFQRRSAQRAEVFARQERLRQERLTAYSACAGAITELKRAVVGLWLRRRSDPHGAEYATALAECDRLGAAAEHARFRVQLVAEDPALTVLADAAFATIGAVRDAAGRTELLDHEARCLDALGAFMASAAAQVR